MTPKPPLRVLMYLPTPGGMTGAPRRVLSLARGLAADGAEPILAAPPDSALAEAARQAGLRTAPLEARGILARRQGALLAVSAPGKVAVAVALARHAVQVALLARRSRADIVWTRGAKGVAFAGPGAALAKKPLVWDVDYEPPSRGSVARLHRLGLGRARGGVAA